MTAPTLKDQLNLEKEMLDIGRNRYNANLNKLEERGDAGNSTYANQLIKHVITGIAQTFIDEYVNYPATIGLRHTVRTLCQGIDPERIALIGLRTMFDMHVRQPTVVQVASAIGVRIEDDAHFARFEKEHEEYYNCIIDQFKSSNTNSYRHKHRVLNHLAGTHDVKWNHWTVEEKIKVGSCIMDCVMSQESPLFRKELRKTSASARSSSYYMTLTDEAFMWIMEHKESMELMRPEKLPLIIPPAEWTCVQEGGYYNAQLRSRTPLVKYKNAEHKRMCIHDMDSTKLCQVVNKVQATPWEVNTKVMQVMQEVWDKNLGTGMPPSQPIVVPACPLPAGWVRDGATENEIIQFDQWKRDASIAHTAERERQGRCLQLSRALSVANRFSKYEKIYFTYQADFRMRLYCASPVLQPQGADFAKGLLSFHERKPLGKDGGYWLMVHGANLMGVDKVSYDDRVKYVRENADAYIAVAKDPISTREVWGNADKPWQFLAFCFEFAEWAKTGYSESYASNLCVALDGTCNGLQHFSGMLRDAIGGAATNLVDADVPQDIYGVVADVTNASLIGMINLDDAEKVGHAKKALALNINRKCTKRPVMTLPYGATMQSCREYIMDYLRERAANDAEVADIYPELKDLFHASAFLSRVVWGAMGSTLVAATEAMAWLQAASRQVSRRNEAIVWTTPMDTMVMQNTYKFDSVRVQTQLCGSIRLNAAKFTDEIDGRKQASGIAPNFVHSMDAAHMGLTVLSDESKDITSWWLVHDSYGTHACDIPALNRAIRKEFVDMYTNHDVLQEFVDSAGIDTEALPLPSKGDLDINEVLKAKYFFG